MYSQDEDDMLVHISGISLSGDWFDEGLDENDYGTRQSSLPSDLVDFSTALPHRDNYKYVGEKEGTIETLQRAILSDENWEGSNSRSYDHSSTDAFIIKSELCSEDDEEDCF